MKNKFHWNNFQFFSHLIRLSEYIGLSFPKKRTYDMTRSSVKKVARLKIEIVRLAFIPNQNKTRQNLEDFRILRIFDWIFCQVISNYFKYIFDIKARFDCKLSVAFFVWSELGCICDIFSFCTILNFETSVHIFVFNFFCGQKFWQNFDKMWNEECLEMTGLFLVGWDF